MICEDDIAAARDLRDLLEPARSGDLAAARQLRRSLELGWRRVARAARPSAPGINEIIEAAHSADEAMLAALKAAKTTCRTAINELSLTEIPAIGTIIHVGWRRLEVVAVSSAGRLTWCDVDRRTRFTSGRKGRLRPDGGPR